MSEEEEVKQNLSHIVPVKNFPGYGVSADGNIWSCWVKCHPIIRPGQWRKLRAGRDKAGYHQVVLMKNRKMHCRKVHHLVLEAFVGPRLPGQECCHKDDDKDNNRATNLKWGTRLENASDRLRNKGYSHLSMRNARKVKALAIERKLTQKQIGEMFGVCAGTVYNILKGKTWGNLA